jgi:hypothetical protein
MFKVELNVVAPVTFNVELNVVAPLTVSVPGFPVTAKLVIKGEVLKLDFICKVLELTNSRP